MRAFLPASLPAVVTNSVSCSNATFGNCENLSNNNDFIQLKGQTFDCKSIHIEPKALANTIVAMANADGGMIAVGISDKTRRIVGVNQDKTIFDQKRPESDQIKMILELIKEKPQISRSEISHKMGLHESSVKRRLKMMVDKGIIQRIGSDKGGHWQIK